MFLMALPILLFACKPLVVAQTSLLNCEEYDWIVGGMDKSTSMTTRDKAEIRSAIMDQTDPACFELDS